MLNPVLQKTPLLQREYHSAWLGPHSLLVVIRYKGISKICRWLVNFSGKCFLDIKTYAYWITAAFLIDRIWIDQWGYVSLAPFSFKCKWHESIVLWWHEPLHLNSSICLPLLLPDNIFVLVLVFGSADTLLCIIEVCFRQPIKCASSRSSNWYLV